MSSAAKDRAVKDSDAFVKALERFERPPSSILTNDDRRNPRLVIPEMASGLGSPSAAMEEAGGFKRPSSGYLRGVALPKV